MLLLLVLSLLIFDGHARVDPQNHELCLYLFNEPFICGTRPSPSTYIYIQKTEHSDPVNGTQSPIDIINAYSSFVVDDILPDMCSYFKGISACMKTGADHFGRNCMFTVPKLVKIHRTYQNLTSAFCDHLTADVKKLIACANDDNAILATFISCMYGAYHYMLQHQDMDQCKVIHRCRDCLLQFEDCAPMATWNMISKFDENYNDMCSMLKQTTG
ncbi:uncharacterized protein LOC127708176 [Mytilus californianus]|uniref:uncharacterized protein LOC127708176 n=1 Tax=Mytilus californianus TaxID=6549 RepID=UPI002247DF00|nr:uncharacterized protein LOC127708176 [Mytilus californianus]